MKDRSKVSTYGNVKQRGEKHVAAARFAALRKQKADPEQIAKSYLALIQFYLGENFDGTYMPVIDRTEDEQFYGDGAAVFVAKYYDRNVREMNL